MDTVTQAYRFALDPTPEQRRALASHCGAARVAYNWGLELVRARLHEHQIDPSIRVPWTLPELRREWNQAKQQVAPWWAENSKEAYSSGLDGLARALQNWSSSRSGRRRGRRMGFPTWKKKSRSRDTCRFTTGAIRVSSDRKHIQLPRIGVLKTHESTRKLARRLEGGTARILAHHRPAGSTDGSSPSPSRSNGQSPEAAARSTSSASMWASATWRCCRRGRHPFPTHVPWSAHYGSFAESTGNWPVDSPGPGEGGGPGTDSPVSTIAPPTFAAMRCISSPPTSSPNTARWWWWKTSMSPDWCATVDWLVPSVMRASVSCAACLRTSPGGTAVGWWLPIASIPLPRRARPVDG
jgi:hypothetical protein